MTGERGEEGRRVKQSLAKREKQHEGREERDRGERNYMVGFCGVQRLFMEAEEEGEEEGEPFL
jgi:hypothetical protein